MFHTLLLQLARLGDLIQSLPVITSLHTHFPKQQLDLLCAAPLVPLGRLFPSIQRVYPWEGEQWHSFSTMSNPDAKQQMETAKRYLAGWAFPDYTLAYNLNNHPRSILAAHLFSERVVGAGDHGPLSRSCPPWVDYLRQVARERGQNRIHLADAFCGVCGVRPPVMVPSIQARDVELPFDLASIVNDASLVKIGLVLGAGDFNRRVPIATWCRLIEACAEHLPHCVCVLIGGAGEREIAMAIENQLSSIFLSRILNSVGRTTLPQLVHVFGGCQWVIGSDTGPLHLAVACETRAVGWYFSRARVHETGPYGVGHFVWQHQGSGYSEDRGGPRLTHRPEPPRSWPVMETIEIIQGQGGRKGLSEWELWTSHRDDWGIFYMNGKRPEGAVSQRKHVWDRLSDLSSNHYSDFFSKTMIAGCSS